jgi:hypothetical protein
VLCGDRLFVQARQWLTGEDETAERFQTWEQRAIDRERLEGGTPEPAGSERVDESEARAWVLALEKRSGRLLWKQLLGKGAEIAPEGGSRFRGRAFASGAQPLAFAGGRLVVSTHIGIAALVELADGRIQAYFRNSDPRRRIKRSTSTDGGMTWSALEATDRLHPSGGIEALMLANGHLALIYNNKEQSPRDKLAVSISDDGGQTWAATRQLEDTPGGRFDYPSIIQSADGTLHATYSYHLKTIKHVHFNEAWVREGN